MDKKEMTIAIIDGLRYAAKKIAGKEAGKEPGEEITLEELANIDFTQFFTSVVSASNFFQYKISGNEYSSLEWTYKLNQLIVQDLMENGKVITH